MKKSIVTLFIYKKLSHGKTLHKLGLRRTHGKLRTDTGAQNSSKVGFYLSRLLRP